MVQLAEGEVLRSTTDAASQGLVAVIIIGVFALLAMEKAHRVLVIFGAVALIWFIPDRRIERALRSER